MKKIESPFSSLGNTDYIIEYIEACRNSKQITLELPININIVHSLYIIGYKLRTDYHTVRDNGEIPNQRLILLIVNNKMLQDPRVRELLLEYLI